MGIVELIFAILGSSFLTAFVQAIFTRRKISAESRQVDATAVQVLTNTSVTLLAPLNQQIEFLTNQLSAANERILLLTTKIDELTKQLDSYEKMYPRHD